MNLYFYIPYLYTIKTRLGKKGRLLSYILILVIPPAYFALILQAENPTLNSLFAVIIGTLIIQNNYEIGYIQNDAETIKKENLPTLRLGKEALSYYELNKVQIYLSRFLWWALLVSILFLMQHAIHDTLIFVGIATLIIPIFLIYNSVRNYLNLILHFILTIFKYTAVQFLFLSSFKFEIFLLSLFAYPFLNLLDRAATPRFFRKLSEFYTPKTSKYRMYYYTCLFLICSCLYFINSLSLESLGIVFLYFAFRLSIYFSKIK